MNRSLVAIICSFLLGQGAWSGETNPVVIDCPEGSRNEIMQAPPGDKKYTHVSQCKVLHGGYKMFNGEKLKVEGYWKLGKKHGEWRFYHDDGSLASIFTYDNDKEISREYK